MLKRFIAWKEKILPPKVKLIHANSVFNEPVKDEFDLKKTLLEECVAKISNREAIPHEMLNGLAFAYYDIKIKRSFYKLRNSENSLLFFELDGIELLTSANGKALDGLNIMLKDASLGTSLILKLSIKDYEELLIPITFN